MRSEIEQLPQVLFYAVGYEERSSHVASKLGAGMDRRIALGFKSRQVASFNRNRQLALDSGADYFEVSTPEFRIWVREELPKWLEGVNRVGLDVSSFSRDRLSAILLELWQALLSPSSLDEIALFYAPGAFDTRGLPVGHTVVASAELLPGFEGDWCDPERPATAIIGLGYEPGRALGAVELLEPQDTVLLLPTGVDMRYDREVLSVNLPLLAPGARTVSFAYDVMHPADLLGELLRMIQGMAVHGRAVLVPLGPKIFAATACIASLVAERAVPVWRLSGGESGDPFDVRAEGSIAQLVIAR